MRLLKLRVLLKAFQNIAIFTYLLNLKANEEIALLLSHHYSLSKEYLEAEDPLLLKEFLKSQNKGGLSLFRGLHDLIFEMKLNSATPKKGGENGQSSDEEMADEEEKSQTNEQQGESPRLKEATETL